MARSEDDPPLGAPAPRWQDTLDLRAGTEVRAILVSDTHGMLDERIAALVDGADLVVHAGDIGSHRVLTALQRAAHAIAVTGNNDVAEQWDVPAIPAECVVTLPGGTLVVEHGHRRTPARDRHQKLRQRHASARAVVYGHSHVFVLDDSELPVVINPGASGRVRTHGGPSCVVLTASATTWTFQVRQFAQHDVRRLEFDVPMMIESKQM